jgi:cell division protein FtsQ
MSHWGLRPKVWRYLTRLLLGATVVLWMVALWPRLTPHLFPTIATVTISVDYDGRERIAWPEVADEVARLVRGQPFFFVDLYRLRERLLHDPAIAAVAVERIWPDQLVVTVRPRVAVLRWYDPKAARWYWLDAQARPFHDQRDPEQTEAGPVIGASADRLLDAVDLLKAVVPILPESLALDRLDYSELGSVTLTLKPKVTLALGQVASTAVAAQKVRWFVHQWPRLVQAGGEPPTRVDLRYERAFAVAYPQRLANPPTTPALRSKK